ncbi:MAG TPA: DUF998 domain-containing protein [Steroidobacteraceae bacterium]|nr:DUF998 domain-containing protein [Steroidobacteraceae bacterium]
MTDTSGALPAAVQPTPATRALLTSGVIAGPLFVAVAFLQAFTREGFDLKRHPFSLLSLGDLGWIQIANFVLAGLLFTACAVGMRRVLQPGRGGTWGPLLMGAFGVSLIFGGLFLADPGLGFPPGAPEGPPASVSASGIVHGLAFAVGMSSLIAAFFVLARRFASAGDRTWARYSVISGVLFLLLTGVGVPGGDFRIVALAIVIGWAWASLTAAHLRASPPRAA